jgi:hypothetical protein
MQESIRGTTLARRALEQLDLETGGEFSQSSLFREPHRAVVISILQRLGRSTVRLKKIIPLSP